MTEEQKPKLTEKEVFDRLKRLYGEILMLTEDVREFKAEAKENGLAKDRISYLDAAAKISAQCKEAQEQEKLEGKLEALKEFA